MPFPTARSRAALDALCRRIVPAAFATDPPVDIVAHVEARIGALDPAMRRELLGALHFFDHPITGMLLSGRPRRFSSLPESEQDAMLVEWQRSSLGLRRTVFQAVRRLILATFYALPENHAAIGYLSAPQRRDPAFPWEGAAPDAGSDGPIRRGRGLGTEPRRAHSPLLQGITAGAAVPDATTLSADVCVIGSGAGGAVVAARLAQAGRHVVVLEEGGHYEGDDFDDDETRLTSLLYADGAARATDDLSCVLLQGRCVGGGTTVNWMMTLRPQPWVMHEWQRDLGVEMLGERMLVPALEAVERDISARPVPYELQNPANRVIVDGCNALGWSMLQARVNADGCVRAGSCGLGCRWGAKQSAGTVYLPRVLRAGARIICDARADRVELVERAGATPLKRVAVTVLDRATRAPRTRFLVEAPVVVLAAGAVGTPVLLEKSGMGGGGVGRWLRLHPTTGTFGAFDRVMYPTAGVPQTAVCSEFLRGDDGYGFWIETPALRPGLAAAALPGFGATHRALMQSFTHMGPLILLLRDGADRRRSSGDVRVDRAGRVRIRYRLGTTDRRRIIHGVQSLARLSLAAGASRVYTLHNDTTPVLNEQDVQALALRSYAPNQIGMFSAHVNGTCRMGTDPAESGCTPEGERHGVRGLFVADGSLFPTAPGVNPQSTIMALASLVADRILDRPL